MASIKSFTFSTHYQLLLCVVLAFIVGLLNPEIGPLLDPIGQLFIKLLKMMIIPLVMSSIIVAINRLVMPSKLNRVGLYVLVYTVMTSVIAIGIGVSIAVLAKPGVDSALSVRYSDPLILSEKPTLSTLFSDIVPDNLYAALADGNMLPVLFFAIVFGIALLALGKKGGRVVEFFDGLYQVFLQMTQWIMLIAPIGVFCLIVSALSQAGWEGLKPISFFAFSVLIGLIMHSVLFIPLLLRFYLNLSPTQLFHTMMPALVTVFSTASNATTLPISLSCMRNSKTAHPAISQFYLPLGITINMNGSSIFLVISVLFIAQLYGVSLAIIDYLLIVVISFLASIATAALPGASLVTLILILSSIGLPVEGIGLILAVDRFLDMARSTVNLWSNAAGVEFISQLSGATPMGSSQLSQSSHSQRPFQLEETA